MNIRCYKAKIEESEKAGSRRELNPGHRWFEPPVLCHALRHDSRTTTNPNNPLYVLPVAASLIIFLYFRLITSK